MRRSRRCLMRTEMTGKQPADYYKDQAATMPDGTVNDDQAFKDSHYNQEFSDRNQRMNMNNALWSMVTDILTTRMFPLSLTRCAGLRSTPILQKRCSAKMELGRAMR